MGGSRECGGFFTFRFPLVFRERALFREESLFMKWRFSVERPLFRNKALGQGVTSTGDFHHGNEEVPQQSRRHRS